MSRLVCFTGKMGVGKSEAIKLLNSSDTVLVKFAQPLYDMQEYIYNRISSVYARPESFIKDRKLLQWLGTEWGRDTISQTLWVDLWKAEVTKNLSRGKLVVCDDVRFDNEAQAVKSLGGLTIKIISDKTDKRIDTQSGINNHSSEAGIHYSYIDAMVENNGTLEEFQAKLTHLYGMLGVGNSAATESTEHA